MDSNPTENNMAAAVANAQAVQSATAQKRYRPAPAKTFQCRGYGECRMVFSRSEHLARHIRKHTGERPFTCHCGKQFSRLDNLRQHAQTVHADKQDQNERMMRDLTTLHASMAAANKMSSTRSSRRAPHNHTVGVANPTNGNPTPASFTAQEDLGMPRDQRPGTSATGYEGDNGTFLYHQPPSWHVQNTESTARNQPNSHSFRDSSQSFLASQASSTSAAAAAAPGQSFLPFSSSFGVSLPDPTGDNRPRTTSSRPPTSSGHVDPNSRSLPPLAAVVSASLAPSPRQQHLQPFPAPPGSSHGYQQHGTLLLPGSAVLRRPSTAKRPDTAPPGPLFSAKSAFTGGPGMGLARSDLPLQSYGGRTPAVHFLGSSHASTACDPEPSSPSGHDASPFFFSPPSLDTPATTSPINPRKRTFAGPDGPYDDTASAERDTPYDYDYGTESRPQSRRLTVMELCNDPDDDARPPSFLLSAAASRPSAAPESRPTTSGLVSSASALALVDRPSPTLSTPPLQSRSPHFPSGGNGFGTEEHGRNRLPSSAVQRTIPSLSSVLPFRSGPTGGVSSFAHTPSFSSTYAASHSPRSASNSISPFSPRNPLSGSDAPAIPNRNHGDESQRDQIRFPDSSRTSPLGLRV